MKISPPISKVAAEIEAWARLVGWKTVGLAIAEQYHAAGGGEILPAPDTEKGLDNATQRVKRIFRGYDGPRYEALADQLKPAALAALPTERRARLEQPASPVYLAAVANREFTEAINAIHLGAAPAEIIREAREAVAAINAAVTAATKQLFIYS